MAVSWKREVEPQQQRSASSRVHLYVRGPVAAPDRCRQGRCPPTERVGIVAFEEGRRERDVVHFFFFRAGIGYYEGCYCIIVVFGRLPDR